MKQFIRLSIISGLLVTNIGFAFNPIQGFYGGVTAAVSHGPSNYTRLFSVPNPDGSGTIFNFVGTVNYNFLGGGGGGLVGYRIGAFRAEGEIFYNYIGTTTMTVGNCTLESPTVDTPTGICPAEFVDNNIGFNGSSGALYGMANAYYDFYLDVQDDNPIVPYIGIGVGMAKLRNSVNFVATYDELSVGGNISSIVPAGQIIAGVSYFLDDYAWISMDLRYLSTGNITNQKTVFNSTDFVNFLGKNTSRYSVEAINFSVNASFDNSAKDY